MNSFNVRKLGRKRDVGERKERIRGNDNTEIKVVSIGRTVTLDISMFLIKRVVPSS